MKSVFEGQALRVSHIDHDLLQVKGERTITLRKTGFFVVPTFGETSRENLLVLSYYKSQKLGAEEREGLLRYQELADLPVLTPNLVFSEVFVVKKPLAFWETSREGQRYLVVTPNIDGKYNVTAEKGTLVRDGHAYKVFGAGPYLFRGGDILYRFGHAAPQ